MAEWSGGFERAFLLIVLLLAVSSRGAVLAIAAGEAGWREAVKRRTFPFWRRRFAARLILRERAASSVHAGSRSSPSSSNLSASTATAAKDLCRNQKTLGLLTPILTTINTPTIFVSFSDCSKVVLP